MKNSIKLVSLLMSFLLLFSSCQSVYDAPLAAPETTVSPDVDLNDEYYTTGMPYHTGDIYSGLLYEGCLIYIETCTTTGITGYRTSPDGEKIDKGVLYSRKIEQELVKLRSSVQQKERGQK